MAVDNSQVLSTCLFHFIVTCISLYLQIISELRKSKKAFLKTCITEFLPENLEEMHLGQLIRKKQSSFLCWFFSLISSPQLNKFEQVSSDDH